MYSSSISKDINSGWSTSPGWESSGRRISVVKRSSSVSGAFKGEAVDVTGCDILRNGSCSALENGLYLRQPENIDDCPHYLKEAGTTRRHLFFVASKGCWQVRGHPESS